MSVSSPGLWMTPNQGGVPGAIEGKTVLHRHLDGVEGWASRNLLKIEQGQTQSPALGWSKSLTGHRLGSAWLGDSSAGKALGVAESNKLDMRPQHALAAKRSNCVLSSMNRGSQLTGGGSDYSPLLSTC